MNAPSGWVITNVGNYLYLKNGFAFKSANYIEPTDSSFPVLRISDLNGLTASDKKAVHVEDGAVGFEVKKGDLLIAMSGATTGKVGVYHGCEPAYQNQRVGSLKLHSEKFGSIKYRNYLILSLSDQILKIAYGGAQPNISGKAIEGIEVLLPPLAEQKVIADKLDSLLAQVETTKARLDRVPDILKRFRQSVLAAAVSGRLTEEWRASRTDCKVELFQADQENVLEDREGVFELTKADEVPSYWIWCPLAQVGKVSGGGTPKKSEDGFWGGDISWVTPKDMKVDKITASQIKITKLGLEKSSAKLIPTNSIIYVVRGMILAHSFPVAITQSSLTINQDMKALTPNESVLSEYLLLTLQAKKGIFVDLAGSSTHGTKRLESKKYLNVAIPVPSILEQTEIVRRVEELFAFADTVEQKAQAATERVNKLTQSILAKAFRGELTADWRAANPDLISGENSAEALLEKIKAEREALKPKKKTRTKKVKP